MLPLDEEWARLIGRGVDEPELVAFGRERKLRYLLDDGSDETRRGIDIGARGAEGRRDLVTHSRLRLSVRGMARTLSRKRPWNPPCPRSFSERKRRPVSRAKGPKTLPPRRPSPTRCATGLVGHRSTTRRSRRRAGLVHAAQSALLAAGALPRCRAKPPANLHHVAQRPDAAIHPQDRRHLLPPSSHARGLGRRIAHRFRRAPAWPMR